MDNEENKQNDTYRNSIPYVQLNRIDSDYAFALALQEQETPLRPFLASESESNDSDEDFEGDSETDDCVSDEMNEIDEAELLDLNKEASNDDEDLIALGEFVGTENKGLSTDKIKSCITPYAYKSQLEGKYGVDQCVICQTEYEEEEQVMTLPCDHMYHSECITTWLQIKKVCAICNTEISENLP
ncbi:E3 ubiquitin ligase BIG BROTHER-related-like isoform X2 [Papaver somniferum]|uniref:E3 ubiquitin ligase BIG BROTHER-related-like isoform X2 n=1 Tax=Papaver somniferum TaxID=3469 RepID=UPI000E700D51|nr:E3 ubiquitin ligase BIG BROTHER-related-like isoform X2 [Papaver somniferum]